MLGSQRMDDVFKGTLSPLSIDWLALGGGGSGGVGDGVRQGGYGGAGRFVSSSIVIPESTSISITVGNAGASQANSTEPGNDGGQTSIIILGTTYTSPGGGGGGQNGVGAGTIGDGRDGGSGGGGGAHGLGVTTVGGSAQAGSPIAGFGNNGEGKASGDTGNPSGNGGGAGGVPTGLAWVDGITYCEGGSGGVGTTYGSGGGGAASPSSGAGQSGVVKIRYSGTPKATGGTITQSGGYTYHTFTSDGTFTY